MSNNHYTTDLKFLTCHYSWETPGADNGTGVCVRVTSQPCAEDQLQGHTSASTLCFDMSSLKLDLAPQ